MVRKPHYLRPTGTKRAHRIPKEWRDHAKNCFPWLKEHWYQLYVQKHPDEFGLTSLQGPFKSGADFKGILNGRNLSVEIEKDYVSYLYHGHPRFDVLIVGVLDPPHPDMLPLLPPVIMHLDPQKVMDWSKPMRSEYMTEMAERSETLQDDLEWVQDNIDFVRRYDLTRQNRLRIEFKDQRTCNCGGLMLETGYLPYIDGEVTEGQEADYEGGFWRVFKCNACGVRESLEA